MPAKAIKKSTKQMIVNRQKIYYDTAQFNKMLQ
jgi:hypothetical protein